MLAKASRRVGADAEHRVVRGDPRKLLKRSCPVDRDVRPGAGCDLQVAPQDWGAGAGLDFLQAHTLAAASPRMISEKNTPMDRTMAEFWNVALMPAPTGVSPR